MSVPQKIGRVVFVAQAVISVLMLALLCCIVFAEVIFRYVLGAPLTWTEELSRFMFVWLTFVGFGIAVHRRQEMKVDFFLGLMSKTVRRIADIVLVACMLVACAGLVFKGLDLVLTNFDVLSVATEIPYSFVYLAVPLGFGLVFVQYALRLFSLLTSAKEHDQ